MIGEICLAFIMVTLPETIQPKEWLPEALPDQLLQFILETFTIKEEGDRRKNR
jgi:hypothetical protein